MTAAAQHTVIVSDMHVSEVEEPDPKRPLWMAYKRKEFAIDNDFAEFLKYIDKHARAPIELILNGDIFDFDTVTELPEKSPVPIDWLATARGLGSEEWMSQFKMSVIIRDHPEFFHALGEFVRKGHRAVFVIGNHDAELFWPSVQHQVCEALGVEAPASLLDEESGIYEGFASLAPGRAVHPTSQERDPSQERVIFCNWFYISGRDTYVSHGHQYDPNCSVKDPINPLIEIHGRPRVRIPFGDLAGRYMLNGMGYFNPNAHENYIMDAKGYLRFFFRYMVRTQPLLAWSWLWGAVVTFWISLRDQLLHPMKDPLLVERKVKAIAERSNATPAIVRKLDALHVPSASNNAFRIARELWLDRAFLVFLIFYGAWQIVLMINIILPIRPLWTLGPIAIFMLPYLIYAASVQPTVFTKPLLHEDLAKIIARITGTKNVVFGHTHKPAAESVGPMSYYNGGFWSLAFSDPECTQRIGKQTFVWIRPGANDTERQVAIYEWSTARRTVLPFEPLHEKERPSMIDSVRSSLRSALEHKPPKK